MKIVPDHLAIILDGNGRWAKRRGLPRLMGHRAGLRKLEDMVRLVKRRGIRYFSVYAFSTENWSRPKMEVEGLMSLFRYYIRHKVDAIKAEGGRIRFAGRRDNIPPDLPGEDDRRRYVVVSAPGKTCGEDTKTTDLLYIMKNLNDHNQNYEAVLKNIKDKYNEIISGIGISLDLEVEFEKIIAEMKKGCSVDYIASRGEYLNALILAKYLGMEFLDSKDMIFFDTKGKFDEEITYAIMSNKLKNVERAVIPGFYGATPTGKIKTFTRGGSDLTGSIVARSVNAKLYENWTDVS